MNDSYAYMYYNARLRTRYFHKGLSASVNSPFRLKGESFHKRTASLAEPST